MHFVQKYDHFGEVLPLSMWNWLSISEGLLSWKLLQCLFFICTHPVELDK